MQPGIGIRTLGVTFPTQVRRNDCWEAHHPELLQRQRDDAARATPSPQSAYERCMARYLSDPFRGARERRVLEAGRGGLELETEVVESVLRTRGLPPSEVELLIGASLVGDRIGFANAALIAQRLGMRGMAFGVEAACAGSLIIHHLAFGLLQAKQYRRIIGVAGGALSRHTQTSLRSSLSFGDAAAAFELGELPPGDGWLGGASMHLGRTEGAVVFEPMGMDGELLRVAARGTARALSLNDVYDTAIVPACEAALAASNTRLEEIDFFIFPATAAWTVEACAELLGVPLSKTINLFPKFGYTGPAGAPLGLYCAAAQGKIAAGARVLLVTLGVMSSICAAVLRWSSQCRLAPAPADMPAP